MFKWLISIVRRIWRVIIVKAQYWTALAAMALPLGVSLIALSVVFPDLKTWLMYSGFVLMVFGFILSIVGWTYTIKEEQQKRIEERLRVRKEKASLIVLIHMAEKLGVDMTKVVDKMEEKLDGK
jgi:hypothetical protein